MIAVRVMKVAADVIIDVIAVRNRLVAAAGAVDMARVMTAAAMVGGAVVGVGARHLDHVLVHVTLMGVVQVTVVQIVGVVAVAHGEVPLARPVLVSVVRVVWCRTGGHLLSAYPCPGSAGTAVRLSAAWSIALLTNGNTCSSASV